ncbi:MAG: FAD-binding oxidoreductase [Myxococcales bacterium]|nr:FAD-binding oxidoreductase [Myxococcales bacterium]
MACDVAVVGGGIAGLSAAARLAGACRVCLFERDAVIGAHASGRNAAIYRPLEEDEISAALARRSQELLAGTSEQTLLSAVGLTLVSGRAGDVERQRRRAASQGVPYRVLEGEALAAVHPELAGGEIQAGLLLTGGGVLDIHAILRGLEQQARAAGARVQTRTGVRRVLHGRGHVTGLELDDGTTVAASHVVIAAGAWSAGFSAGLGLNLPLQPYRRHLVQLSPEAGASLPGPVTWRLDDEVYVRREGTGLLASPCDEVPALPGEVAAESHALEHLARKLTRLAPGLSGAGAQTIWACLRTFAPDRQLVVGPDPRLAGLHWLTGLGGKGMSVAPAVGELLARALLDMDDLDRSLHVARLI